MKRIFSIILSVLLFTCLTSEVLSKEPSQGPVKVEGRDLFVDFDGDGVYQSYKIKGVGYSPHPVGTFLSEWGVCEYCIQANDCLYPDSDPTHAPFSCLGPDIVFDRADVDLDRDFSYIVDMNMNTIRTWGVASRNLLDRAQGYGIKVAAGLWIDYNVDIDPNSSGNIREEIKQQFRDYVNDIKDSPALLMWVVGNENNIFHNLSDKSHWYSLVDELALVAYQEEGLNYHPVATVDADIQDIGLEGNSSTDLDLPNLDIWGTNVYRGNSFYDLFTDFESRSQKPLWISEYGIDAYDNVNNQEYPQTQADWDLALLNDLVQESVCIGSTLMTYSDEWWSQDQWTNEVAIHDREGFSRAGAAPDNFLNEEYWGIMRIQDNGQLSDILTPRQEVYNALKDRFATFSSPPQLNPIGSRVYQLGGIIEIEISAFDLDGDALEISYVGLPDFLNFTDYGNGTATIIGNAEVAGEWDINVTISDGNLIATENFSISSYLCGDVNLNGQMDISDLIYLIDYMFRNGPEPEVFCIANMDGSSEDPIVLDISDLVWLVDYMFLGGSEPICSCEGTGAAQEGTAPDTGGWSLEQVQDYIRKAQEEPAAPMQEKLLIAPSMRRRTIN